MLDLEFNLKRSNYYLGLLVSVLLANSFVVFYLPFALSVKLIIFFMMTIYVGYIIWRHVCLQSKHSIRSIRRHADGSWSLQTKSKRYSSVLRGESTVTTLISILRFRAHNEVWPRSCIIFCDALPADRYRQLLITLRSEKIN